MKKLITLLALVLSCQFVLAQDEAIFSHYTINPILINPASAGFDESYGILFNGRAQWTGFVDAPQTYHAIVEGPIGKTFGLGINVMSESAAQLKRMKVQMNNSFRFSIKDNVKLAAGFSFEFQRMTIDGDVTSGNFFQAGDRLLEDILDGKGIFDASLGLYSTFFDRTYVGLTFNNLVRSRLEDIAGVSSQSFFQYYTFLAGHEFDLIDLKFKLRPSILIRQVRNAPFQVDLNLIAGFLDDQLSAGLSYRSIGALGILLGTKLANFDLYYSYDLSFQEFQQYNAGSHELTISINIKKKNKMDLNKY